MEHNECQSRADEPGDQRCGRQRVESLGVLAQPPGRPLDDEKRCPGTEDVDQRGGRKAEGAEVDEREHVARMVGVDE